MVSAPAADRAGRRVLVVALIALVLVAIAALISLNGGSDRGVIPPPSTSATR
jgi:hypothetical protein